MTPAPCSISHRAWGTRADTSRPPASGRQKMSGGRSVMCVNRSVQTDPQPGAQPLRLMNADDVAEVLGITKKTVHKLVRDGKLGCVEITERDRRFTAEQVREFIDGHSKPVRIDKPKPVTVESRPWKGGGRQGSTKSTEARTNGSLVKELHELCR